MAYGLVNDSGAREQYTALAAQTNFAYPFEIFADGDLTVWLTPVGQTPDPVADLLVLNTDYTVTGAGAEGGGDVVLVVAATADDIITIERDVPINRLADYSVGGDFSGASINQQLDKLTMTQQQNEMVNEKRQLTYLPTDQLVDGDVDLPKLANGQFWKKGDAGALVAVTLEESAGWSALRSELANNLSGADGARIVGYYDSHAGSTTVHNIIETLNIKVLHYFVAAGTPNNYTGTIAGITSYFENLRISFAVSAPNTGAATININSLGAKNLTDPDENALIANDLEPNHVYTFIYAAGKFVMYKNVRSTETREGIIQIATEAEVKAGTNLTKSVVPGHLPKHPAGVSAWVNFDGQTGAINDSFGITSVTRTGAGTYDVVLSDTMLNVNYCIQATATMSVGLVDELTPVYSSVSTTGFTLETWPGAGAKLDAIGVSALVIGKFP